MKRRIYAALPFVLCISAPALAVPTIYKGMIGKHDVVVEFADDIAKAKKPVAGRYFYPAQGVDIPLNPVSAGSGKAELDEEKPCSRDTCMNSKGDEETKPPVNARWKLTASSKGTELVGRWEPKNGLSLRINLQRVASRSFGESYHQLTAAGKAHAETPDGLASIANEAAGVSKLFSQISPYDFLKMQVKLQEGPETQWGDVAFRYVVDPRTKFGFPRITRHGSPIDAKHPANVYLQSQHWRLSLDALSCKSMQYKGFEWTEVYPGSEVPNLGGFDEQTIRVEYLSPAVMSWMEAGSVYCGGAHLSNFINLYNLDVRQGTSLDLSRIFHSWVPRSIGEDKIVDLATARANPSAYSWGPNDELESFLLKHAEEKDPDWARDCGLKDILKEHLQISFKQENRAVFSLSGLRHAISGVCGGEFFDLPLADIRKFLTPEAAEYFPSLRNR